MKYKNYSIQPEPACPWLYSVSFEGITPEFNPHGKKNKNAGQPTTTSIAYGCKLPEAIEIIAHQTASKEDFEVFLKEFKEAIKDMTKLVTDCK